ncbi:hypothetical protein ACJX0J_002095 (mitochondrion) [Zea mays]
MQDQVQGLRLPALKEFGMTTRYVACLIVDKNEYFAPYSQIQAYFLEDPIGIATSSLFLTRRDHASEDFFQKCKRISLSSFQKKVKAIHPYSKTFQTLILGEDLFEFTQVKVLNEKKSISREKTPHIYIYNRKMKGLFWFGQSINSSPNQIPEKHAALSSIQFSLIERDILFSNPRKPCLNNPFSLPLQRKLDKFGTGIVQEPSLRRRGFGEGAGLGIGTGTASFVSVNG